MANMTIEEQVADLNKRYAELSKEFEALKKDNEEFKRSTYKATMDTIIESNAVIYALQKRGLLTTKELDDAWKQIEIEFKKQQEKAHEAEDKGKTDGAGAQGAGPKL